MNHDVSTFLSGCAPFKGYIFFAKELDEMVTAGQPNSSFFNFDEDDTDGQFRQFKGSVGWPAIAMATIKPDEDAERVVVAIGPNGDYWECEPGSLKKTTDRIPDFRGNLRNLSVVDDVIYACGMGRIVLQRQGLGQWTSLGPGERKGDADVVGFEDIGGYSADEMYAVGWGGEIWWRDKGKWRQVDSPTSVNLRALHCAEDGSVYVVGRDGTMVRGRRDVWAVIDTGRTENLMDVASYEGTVYVTTNFRILKLTDRGLVNDDDFADADRPKTCLYLLPASDGLVSLGTKDLFRRNGGSWSRLV
jgi:hypothetical protein